MADEPKNPCQGQCQGWTIKNLQRSSHNDQYCPSCTTLMNAYADDLAIACSGRSKIDMTKKLQKEVDKVVKWSDDARLTLNTNKCEVSFFSLCTAEASWQPHITIRDLPFSFNAAPLFLGVQYDRQFTFSEHAKKVCQAMTKRTSILRALGDTTWGGNQ